MVIKRTNLSKDLNQLKKELRELLYPFTALKFQEVNRNKLKDLIKTGENFGVNNFLFLSEKEKGVYLKLVQTPNEKTYTFRIKQFSLQKDLVKANICQQSVDIQSLGTPYLVCKGFDEQIQGVSFHLINDLQTRFESLMPNEDYFVNNKIKKVKRVIMIHMSQNGQIELRNYLIK